MAERAVGEDATIEQLGEFGLIDRLARLVGAPGVDPLRPAAAGEIAIGDDAALWQPTPGYAEVLTTDALIEDVHFRLSTTSWEDLGWKALAENVSDIAAMGARPTRAFITLALKRGTRVADLESLYRGMAALARQHDLEIAGGDTVSSPVTMLSVIVVGELRGDGLRRAAGRAGDLLAVTGVLGASAGGLAVLESGGPALDDADALALAEAHRRPRPRVAEGLALAEADVRCGMDLSDGLLGDAGKLAYASGLSATLELDRLPLPPALERRHGADARSLALAGGEDYELLVAAPPDVLDRAAARLRERGLASLTVVGRLETGEPGQVRVLDAAGRPVPAPRGSWDHFVRQDGPST